MAAAKNLILTSNDLRKYIINPFYLSDFKKEIAKEWDKHDQVIYRCPVSAKEVLLKSKNKN